MSSDLDHMLTALEKQVHDFSLPLGNSVPKQRAVDLQRSVRTAPQVPGTTGRSAWQQECYASDGSSDDEGHRKKPSGVDSSEDDDDDDVCIGHLQQTAMPNSHRNVQMLGRSPSVPQKPPLLMRSLSVGTQAVKPTIPTEPMPALQRQEDDDDDLQSAMQRAWAVLDANDAAVTEPPVKQSADQARQQIDHVRDAVPIRIYIDDAKNHKTVQLTSVLTTAMIVHYLKNKGLIDMSNDWALFEIANSHGVERPLRNWEIVKDIVDAWEPGARNALLVKKYAYHSSLTAEQPQSMHGWVSIEYKKGKWQKRYCYLKDNAMHHAKDNKGTGSAILCHLSTFDVYTLLEPVRSAPSHCVFALRAQDPASIFERQEDYMRLLAVDDPETMKAWVIGIRSAKNSIDYQHHPHRVMNPLSAPLEEPGNDRPRRGRTDYKSDQSGDEAQQQSIVVTMRRHKSAREGRQTHAAVAGSLTVKTHRSDGTNHGDEMGKRVPKSGTRGLSRSGTMRHRDADIEGPLIDCSEKVPFAKGSLLDKSTQGEPVMSPDEAHPASSTLIQIDSKFKFSKGSLLEQQQDGSPAPVAQTAPAVHKISRSKSAHHYQHHYQPHNHHPSSTTTDAVVSPTLPSSEQRRHVSLRRKPTSSRSRHPSIPTSPGPLLQLDGTPEQSHTKSLLERQMKPLLNFSGATDDRSNRRAQ